MGEIRTKRAYEPPARGDGQRFLVDRLWPRGRKKEDLKIAGWLKALAPSNALRKSFCHDPAKWPEFKKHYHAELKAHPEQTDQLVSLARKGTVTLVFGARDPDYNNAVALKEFLDQKL